MLLESNEVMHMQHIDACTRHVLLLFGLRLPAALKNLEVWSKFLVGLKHINPS